MRWLVVYWLPWPPMGGLCRQSIRFSHHVGLDLYHSGFDLGCQIIVASDRSKLDLIVSGRLCLGLDHSLIIVFVHHGLDLSRLFNAALCSLGLGCRLVVAFVSVTSGSKFAAGLFQDAVFLISFACMAVLGCCNLDLASQVFVGSSHRGLVWFASRF